MDDQRATKPCGGGAAIDRLEALTRPRWGEADFLQRSSKAFDEFSGCHYAWLFHAGLAVETAAKAVLIAADPIIITNGSVRSWAKFGARTGHELTSLVRAALGDELLSEADEAMLRRLEEHVVWVGKYTVPMKADVLYDHATIGVLRNAPAEPRGIVRGLVGRLTERTKETVRAMDRA